METLFDLVFGDLTIDIPEVVQIMPPPYTDDLTDRMKIDVIFQLIKRAQRRKNRKAALTYAFYLGEMVEADEVLRKIAKRKISTYYFQAAIRVYYIFENCPEQIQRTERITLSHVRGLSSFEYQQLQLRP